VSGISSAASSTEGTFSISGVVSGSGDIDSPVVIVEDGGVIAPGDEDSNGSIGLSGDLIVNEGGSIEMDVASNGYDSISVSGGLHISGAIVVSSADGVVSDPDSPLPLLSAASASFGESFSTPDNSPAFTIGDTSTTELEAAVPGTGTPQNDDGGAVTNDDGGAVTNDDSTDNDNSDGQATGGGEEEEALPEGAMYAIYVCGGIAIIGIGFFVYKMNRSNSTRRRMNNAVGGPSQTPSTVVPELTAFHGASPIHARAPIQTGNMGGNKRFQAAPMRARGQGV